MFLIGDVGPQPTKLRRSPVKWNKAHNIAQEAEENPKQGSREKQRAGAINTQRSLKFSGWQFRDEYSPCV